MLVLWCVYGWMGAFCMGAVGNCVQMQCVRCLPALDPTSSLESEEGTQTTTAHKTAAAAAAAAPPITSTVVMLAGGWTRKAGA